MEILPYTRSQCMELVFPESYFLDCWELELHINPGRSLFFFFFSRKRKINVPNIKMKENKRDYTLMWRKIPLPSSPCYFTRSSLNTASFIDGNSPSNEKGESFDDANANATSFRDLEITHSGKTVSLTMPMTPSFGTAFAGSNPTSSAAATPPPSPTTRSELRNLAATLQPRKKKCKSFFTLCFDKKKHLWDTQKEIHGYHVLVMLSEDEFRAFSRWCWCSLWLSWMGCCDFRRRRLWSANLFRQLRFPLSNSERRWNLYGGVGKEN